MEADGDESSERRKWLQMQVVSNMSCWRRDQRAMRVAEITSNEQRELLEIPSTSDASGQRYKE